MKTIGELRDELDIDRILEEIEEHKKEIAEKYLSEADYGLWKRFNELNKLGDVELSHFDLLPEYSGDSKIYLSGARSASADLSKDDFQKFLKEAESRPWDIYRIENEENKQTFLSSYFFEVRSVKSDFDNITRDEDKKGNYIHFQFMGNWYEYEYIDFVKQFPHVNIPKLAVYMWVRGASEFIEAVESGTLTLADPKILEGTTNERHAKFLEKWGASVRKIENVKNRNEDVWEVMIDYDSMKQKLEESYKTERSQELLEFGSKFYYEALSHMNEYLDYAENEKAPVNFWYWYFEKLEADYKEH